MVLVNYATKEIVAKIVYYGPGLCGKTTNLQQIFARLNPRKRGKMISLATEADRTLFFDFLPLELGVVQGFKVRFQLYTVPGQVFYSATRKLVLKGADAVIFVADSQADVLSKNIESYEDMRQNLLENNLDPASIPLVIQYNKRDLPNVTGVKTLDAKINTRHAPWFEAVATKGDGVLETFKEVTKLLIKDLKKKHAMMEGGVVEELPPEVFEPKAPPKAAPKAKEAPADEGFVIERIHDHRVEPEEKPAAPVAAMKEMETISLTDTAQAEAFLDDVRKGAPAEEAKLKAEMVGGLTGDGPYERELTPDELEAASDFQADMEEEKLGAEEELAADEFPEMDFSAMMEPEEHAEAEQVAAPEALADDLPDMDFPEAMDHDTPSVQQTFDQAMREPEPVTAVEPASAEEIWANEMPAMETKAWAEETAVEPVPEAVPETEPETEPEAIPETIPVQEPYAPEAFAPPQPVVTVDTSALQEEIARLEGEIISLKVEVAKLSADMAGGAGRSLAEKGIEELSRSLAARAEGQDRLLLGILETVRENKKASAEMLERVESALNNLIERYSDGTKAAKKKWF